MEAPVIIQDTAGRLRRIIIDYLQSQDIEYGHTNFDKLEDIGIDSLGMLDVIFAIEGEFGVNTGDLNGEILENITTFNGLVAIVDALRA